MSDRATYAGERLEIRRTMPAPLDRVWKAFTDPEEMQRWGAPKDKRVSEFVGDLRVGGSYRLTMVDLDGTDPYVAKGTYREIVPKSRIAYTWTWEEDAPEDEHETFVTWEFRAVGDETEVTLTHVGLRNAESRDGHRGGWTQMFDKFEAYLAA